MAGRDLHGRTLGGFVLREQIGEGGYGAVYRGEQLVLKRDVVVKVLHERRRDDVSEERFLREAQLASRLDHPYAAHVYASGADDKDGLLWIAMELVQGITLAEWLKIHGAMPLEQFVPLFECIAEVVHAAHERGIVHRDLKPSNIMLIERGGRLSPKLLDFGIAKMAPEIAPPMPEDRPDGSFTEDHDHVRAPASGDVLPRRSRVTPQRVQQTGSNRLTPSGACVGSLPYMSPEQWYNAEAVGPGADIYSLGVVAYQALTGEPPFTADSSDEYCLKHRAALPPELCVDPRPELDRVIQRALAKHPRGRHRNVLEMASELRAALRATKREQLRSSAQQWEDADRTPGLLWGGDMLVELERQVSPEKLSELECSFIADSQRRARRIRWIRRLLVALAATGVLVIALMRTQLAQEQTRLAQEQARMAEQRAELQTQLAEEQTRSARQVTEATITQSELEQGRSALLHGEPDAPIHLGRAYQRGDPSPSTAFMYARALQPRLAEQARFASSSGRMWSAAFSPNGRQIVTTDDQGVQIRDAQTGKLLFALPCGDTVYDAAYSFDGARLVAAGGDGTVRIWDATSGMLVRERRRGSVRPRYYSAVMSPDSKLVAAIDTKGNVAHVWNALTGVPIADIRNDGSEFPAIAFSADGHWLATTGGDDVRVFDTRTRRQAVTIHGPRTRSMAFDPTGPRLLTGTATGDVAIWSVPSGARIRHLRDVGDPIEAVAFSLSGQLVVAGSRDGIEQVWQTGSGELQSQLNPRHSKILAVEFDRTSKLVLAAGADGTVVVADAALGMPVTVLEGPQNVVQVAHFDPSSRRVVGASKDGTARVWDATSPYRRWNSPPVADDCGIVTSPEPDSRFIAVGCRSHVTRIWDTSRDQLLAELPGVSRVEGDFTSAFPAVSGTGDRAAIARGNTVEVYELPGGRLLCTIAHGAPVNAVAFARTGRDIVSGAIDGSLLVTRDNGVSRALPTSPGGIDAVGFLPDGRVVTSDAQRRLRVYDPGGVVLADLEIPMRVMSLRIDGTRLVTIPIPPRFIGNAAPLLLDLERYHIIAQLEGHVGRVFSARWVAGDQILTAGANGTARLWDGSTGRFRQTYRGSTRLLDDATLTSDGLVMAGGIDGMLRFWDATSGRLLWALPAHKSQLIGVHIEGSDIVTRGFSGEISRWALPRPEQVIGACGDQERCAILRR